MSPKVRSQYRPSPRARGLHKNHRGWGPTNTLGRGLLWGVGFSTTALVGAIAGLSLGFLLPWGLENLPWLGSEPNAQALSFLPYHLSRPVNILVMGIDRVEAAPTASLAAFAGRSDTMLLVRFDPQARTLKLLSLPRDSRVFIPSLGYSKINDANVQGGARLAAAVVSETLNGVTIDRYVRVTTNAFRELVDLVGGVEVFVPTPMVYQDQTQKLDINLQAGLQNLSGDQAEQFARFRKDANGDIGRVQRQEILLKALQKRLGDPILLTRLPQAIAILQKSVDTNLSLEEILALANFAHGLQRQDVQMVMLPGRFSQPEEFDGKSYWVLSKTGIERVMAQYFDLGAPDSTATSGEEENLENLTIALQNATDNPLAVKQLRRYLREQGFHKVYKINDAPELIRETEIIAQRGDLKNAHQLRERLQMGKVEASSTGDLASDLTIRLGLDATQWLEQLSSPTPNSF